MKKKVGIVVAMLFILVAVIVTIVIINSNNPYKKVVKDFVKACKSEEKMENFVDENIDLRGAYAAFYVDSYKEIPENSGIQFSNPFKNFDESYKNTKKSDYTNSKYIKDLKEVYSQFVTRENIKITKIEKAEKWEYCDVIDAVKATFELDGEKETITFLFYEKKFIGIAEIYLVVKSEFKTPGYEDYDPNAFEKSGVNYGQYEMVKTDYNGDMEYKSGISISNDGRAQLDKSYEKDSYEDGFQYKLECYTGYCVVEDDIMTMKYVDCLHSSDTEKERRDEVNLKEKYKIDGKKLVKISSDIDNDNAVYKYHNEDEETNL